MAGGALLGAQEPPVLCGAGGADGEGRVAENMLSKQHTTGSGKQGDGISLFSNSAARSLMDAAGLKRTAL